MIGRRRTGSVYQRTSDGRWIAVISIGGGRRASKYARSEAEARQLLEQFNPEPRTVSTATREPFRSRSRRMLEDILDRAEAGDWDREQLLDVFAANFTTRRIRYCVTGPCAYCGTEFAEGVDHVIPIADGGNEDPSNLVSSCISCNARKGRRRDFVGPSGVSTAVNLPKSGGDDRIRTDE